MQSVMDPISSPPEAISIRIRRSMGPRTPKVHTPGTCPLTWKSWPDSTDHVTLIAPNISLKKNAPNSVFANGGTAFIIHEKADDMMTDPTGNAGDRIACGVITAP